MGVKKTLLTRCLKLGGIVKQFCVLFLKTKFKPFPLNGETFFTYVFYIRCLDVR